MKSTFSNRSFLRLRNCAKHFIVSAFSLSFFLPFSSASAENYETNTAVLLNRQLEQMAQQAESLSSILSTLNYNLQTSGGEFDIGFDAAQMRLFVNPANPYQSQSLPNYLRYLLFATTGRTSLPVSGSPTGQSLFTYARDIKLNTDKISASNSKLDTANSRLLSIYNLFKAYTNTAQSSTPVLLTNNVAVNVLVTNFGSGVISPDVLAGNPWWYTNSAFTLTKQYDSGTEPQIWNAADQVYSFPEFLSRWSQLLTFSPNGSVATSWSNAWGSSRLHRQLSGATYPYNWFDSITDWIKVRRQDDLSFQSDLLKLLRNISNEVNDSSAYIANHLDYGIADLTNILLRLPKAEDILAGNPWWWTNSSFAVTWDDWRTGHVPLPHDADVHGGYAFPYAFSVLLSQLEDNEQLPTFWDEWGLGGQNEFPGMANRSRLTWFDWVSEAMKSNIVLSSSASYSNLVSEVALYDSSDDPNPTNHPLPEYSLPDSETIPGAEETLSDLESSLSDKIQGLQPQYTSGDDEIVVIPSFDVGGIHVSEYRARLGTSITPVCRRVASFIWYVGLFAFLFSFAKAEFVYYATLGKFWVKVV